METNYFSRLYVNALVYRYNKHLCYMFFVPPLNKERVQEKDNLDYKLLIFNKPYISAKATSDSGELNRRRKRGSSTFSRDLFNEKMWMEY